MNAENIIICGDCLDVMREMPDKCVDLVVTDPPYGIGIDYGKYEDTEENLNEIIKDFLPEIIRFSKRAAVFSGIRNVTMHPKPNWIISISWNTTGSFGYYGFNQWMPLLCYGDDISGFGSINGILKSDSIKINGGGGVGFARKEKIDHPCPKPLTVMTKVIARFSNIDDLIFDPFAGSGTTLVAAKQLGRRYLGVEINPDYVEICKKRLAQEELF